MNIELGYRYDEETDVQTPYIADFTPDRGVICNVQDDDTDTICTLPEHHAGILHVAGDGQAVVAIWGG